ncbi:MAG: acyl carrier protein [Bdellovibrio sp.]
MKEQEVKKIVEDSLKSVAPETNISEINFDLSLRSQVDIDSYDFANMLAKVESRTQVRITESSLHEINSLSDLVRFIVDHSLEIRP